MKPAKTRMSVCSLVNTGYGYTTSLTKARITGNIIFYIDSYFEAANPMSQNRSPFNYLVVGASCTMGGRRLCVDSSLDISSDVTGNPSCFSVILNKTHPIPPYVFMFQPQIDLLSLCAKRNETVSRSDRILHNDLNDY